MKTLTDCLPGLKRAVTYRFKVCRFGLNPLITPDSSPIIGDNINGPSVVRAPDWLRGAPARYLMYFAHHGGHFIRMAVADQPEGPWRVLDARALDLEAVSPHGFKNHIASPDVHVDEENRRLVMFFHGPNPGWKLEQTPGLRTHLSQATGVAFSSDGMNFTPSGGVLGLPYFRVWRRPEGFYALSVRGHLFRYLGNEWPDGSRTFEERNSPLGNWRHCAVWPCGDKVYVFYSRRDGDTPERILCARMDTDRDWREWSVSEPVEVIRPETEAEGASLPVLPSREGAARGRLHELRDPCIFEDAGRVMLYYSIAGESGISGAELNLIDG